MMLRRRSRAVPIFCDGSAKSAFYTTSSPCYNMMEEDCPTDAKRRRITAAGASSQEIRCLTDLPSGILAHAASFLANPSRALFAVALYENSPNERSTAIVGSQWDILDFGEIEKELASRLSDSNIEKVLLCIDAANRVKKLKLTNCVNITGAGLQPLRGSTVIEQFDLSLVPYHESPDLNPTPPISCDDVLPILDSIISQEGCQLKHIQFSYSWRDFSAVHPEFCPFLRRYDQMLQNRDRYSCLKCHAELPTESEENWVITRGGQNRDWNDNHFATQNCTCSVCMKHYCYECEETNAVYMLMGCDKCKRDYCLECSAMDICNYCGKYCCCVCNTYTPCFKCGWNICGDCNSKNKGCSSCSISYCKDCQDDELFLCNYCRSYVCEKCGMFDFCEGEDCLKVCCKKCSQGDTMKGVRCLECSTYFCISCLTRRYNNYGMSDCSECTRRVARFAPSYLEETDRLSEDNKELREEVKKLKDQISRLTNTIKEMELQHD